MHFKRQLAEMKKRNAPLDFFSWHGYWCDPQKMLLKAENIKKLLTEYGYENAESISYLALRPTGGKYENAENYTQIAMIILKEKGRDKVIEAVQYFERISIIIAAEPSYAQSGEGSLDPIEVNE